MNRAALVAQLVNEAIPLSIHWDLTWRCDHKCVHCYLIDRRQDELSLEEAITTLDQLAQAGVMSLLISGGDPFLRPDAIDIIRAARERRFDVKINTHGNFIDEVLADELARLKVSQISLSLYSMDPQEHEAITLITGSHAKTIRAAELLRARGVKVKFKTPIMEHNRKGYKDVGVIAEKLGAEWELDASIIPDDESDFGLCNIGVSQSERMMGLLTSMEARAVPYQGWEDLPAQGENDRVCSAGTVSGYISPDGRVFPCLNWREDLGSLREQSFDEIWGSNPTTEKVRRIRRSSYLGDCDGCAFHTRCNYCPGISHAEMGDASRRSAFVCERTHITMGAAERWSDLQARGESVPHGCEEQNILFDQQKPSFAERQWAARYAGLSSPKDRIRPVNHGLIQISEPRD